MWYTLVRFKDLPKAKDITGVAQAKTAADALNLLETWERDYPEETTVVFDPKNAPVARRALAEDASRIASEAGAPASTH
jgi:hypothetical protein